jgi:hypothetical protein
MQPGIKKKKSENKKPDVRNKNERTEIGRSVIRKTKGK